MAKLTGVAEAYDRWRNLRKIKRLLKFKNLPLRISISNKEGFIGFKTLIGD
ncbi:MAG: hypothetical protein ACFCUM_17500 [Bacteroidales bacterium]